MILQRLRLVPFLDYLVSQLLIPFFRHARSCLQPLKLSGLHGKHTQSKTTTSLLTSAIQQRMPAQSWDTHMHVTSSDYQKYPLAVNAAYSPSTHSLQDAMKFEHTINVPNIVLVQPSIYGTDNSCLLDALKAIGPRRGRGVVEIDPEIIKLETLKEWHELGVRGVRLNLKSRGTKMTAQELEKQLKLYANAIKPLDWVLELFIGMEDIPLLEQVSGELGVRIVIAHFGAPKLPSLEKRTYPLDPYELAGFQSLVNLLRAGNTWIKFSAAYRFDEDPEIRGIEAVAFELLENAQDRIVFASDWPHTRFDGLNVQPFVLRCLQWTEANGATDKVFHSNATKLWDV